MQSIAEYKARSVVFRWSWVCWRKYGSWIVDRGSWIVDCLAAGGWRKLGTGNWKGSVGGLGARRWAGERIADGTSGADSVTQYEHKKKKIKIKIIKI